MTSVLTSLMHSAPVLFSALSPMRCSCGASAPCPLPRLCSGGACPARSSPRRCAIFFRCHPERSEGSAFLCSLATRPLFTPSLEGSLATIPFKIRTYEKSARNPFRIRTSKTQDLKSFRIRTYGKTPRGVPPLPAASLKTISADSSRALRQC
jgi:hypothetical protein